MDQSYVKLIFLIAVAHGAVFTIPIERNLEAAASESSVLSIGLKFLDGRSTPKAGGRRASSVARIAETVSRSDEATGAAAESAPASAVYDEDQLDESPRLLSKPNPRYPEDLVALGIEGQVVLSLLVDASGTVKESEVLSASDERFVREALLEVKKFRFLTPKINSTSVVVRIKWVLNFKLPD